MTFAYDDWVQLPTKDLYDSDIMKMAIATAKDMYDKGQDKLDKFYKEYGDFISPFSKDMARYGQMIGGVRNMINDAYAHGVDLLRTPEGRAMISQAINQINPAELNMMRSNAKTGYEYLKAIREAEAKNMFNPEFENWALTQKGGPGLFSEFETNFQQGGGNMWDRSAPYTYQDLNQYTGHIFDKLEDSYIGTGADHYDYYGVSREQRAKALTDNLAGLLNSPLGKFHYEKAREHAAMLGKDPNDENEVMKQFQEDILTSTTEYEHRNRKLNEMWKLQYEDASRQRAAARSSRGSETGLQNTQWSFAELVSRAGSTAIMGQQPQEFSQKTLDGQRDRQIKIGLQISSACGEKSHSYKAQQMYKNAYGQNQYRPEDVADFISSSCGYKKLKSDPTTLIMDPADVNRLHQLRDVTSHTVGFRGKQFGTDNSDIAKADYITIKPTRGSYQAFMKDATNKNYFEFRVKAYKKENEVDANGNIVHDEKTNQPKTKLTLIADDNRYFDSNITSIKNDPRSGYLGTVDKKTGGITETPNISISTTLDRKYSDAVAADKKVTDKIIQGSVYGSDAIITELPRFGQIP